MKKRVFKLLMVLALCLALLPGAIRAVRADECTHLYDDVYVYTRIEDNKHQIFCKTCNKVIEEDECELDFDYDITSEGHAGKCVCGRVSETRDAHNENVTVPTEGNKMHVAGCSVCGYPSSTATKETHNYGTYGYCTECDFAPVMSDSEGNLYEDFETAMQSGDTKFTLVSPLMDENNNPIIRNIEGIVFDYPGKTVTLKMNGVILSARDGTTPLTVSGGTLIIADAAVINGADGRGTEFSATPAIKVTGGNLTFKGDLTATGGSITNALKDAAPAIEISGGKVTFEGNVSAAGGVRTLNGVGYRYPAIKATGGELDFWGTTGAQVELDLKGGLTLLKDAKLTHLLTGGTFYHGDDATNGYTLAVSNDSFADRNTNYGYIGAMLEKGYAFVEIADQTAFRHVSTTDCQGPYDVTIVTHTHNWQPVAGSDIYQCSQCNEACGHSGGYKTGKCEVCGKPCPHEVADMSSLDYHHYCNACGQQMAVRRTTKNSQGNTVWSHYTSTNLPAALADAKNGDTITLLEDVDNGGQYAIVTGDNKTVTLELKGHTINGGVIYIGRDRDGNNFDSSTLNIVDNGTILGYLGVCGNGKLDLSGWTGGTINTVAPSKTANGEGTLVVSEKAGTINTLGFFSWPSAGVKSKLNGGTYGSISFTTNSNSIGEKFGSLLAPGYAFQYESGEFEQYNRPTTNTDNTIKNVRVVKCTAHVDGDDADPLCDYCNTDVTTAQAKVETGDGKTYYCEDLAAAFRTVNTGGTITLLNNVDLGDGRLWVDNDLTSSLKTTLDLSGKTISGDGNGTGSDDYILGVGYGATLMICDNSTNGGGKIVSRGTNYALSTSSMGTVHISGGTFSSINGDDLTLSRLLPYGGGYIFVDANGNLVNMTQHSVSDVVTVISCPHKSDYVNAETGMCVCGMQMTLKMTAADGTVTYGTDLAAALTGALDGATVTLLANVTNDSDGSETSIDDKTITINLNGNTIDNEISIEVGYYSNATLKIDGNGSVTDSAIILYTNGTLDLSGWESGTINSVMVQTASSGLKSGKGTITYLALSRGGNNKFEKISLNSGTYRYISMNGTAALNELLAEGYAFKGADGLSDGMYYPYTYPITSLAPIDNVTVVPCPHSSISDEGTCAYCGKTGIKAVLTKEGEDGSVTAYTDMEDAKSAWLASGGTLKLYDNYTYRADETLECGGDTTIILDLNGHTFQMGSSLGLFGFELTITDSSTGKNGKLNTELEMRSGSLTLESGYIQKLTVSSTTPTVSLEGGSLGSYKVGEGVFVADLLPAGYGLKRSDNGLFVDILALTSANSGERYEVVKVAEIAAETKTGSLTYGGQMPLLPSVTPTGDIVVTGVEVCWYLRQFDSSGSSGPHNAVGITTTKLAGISGTYNTRDTEGAIDFSNLNAGTTLEVFAVVKATGANGSIVWQTPITGYTLTVTQADITKANVTVGSLTYDGSAQTPTVTVKMGSTTLTAGKDYTVTFNNGVDAINAGDYTLTIEGKGEGNYSGTITGVKWKIEKRVISVKDVIFENKKYDRDTFAYPCIKDVQFDNLPEGVTLSRDSSSPSTYDYGIPEAEYNSANVKDAEFATITVGLIYAFDNYTFANGSRETFVKHGVKILPADQNLQADDITATYGNTGKKITVTGAVGAVTYTVTTGTDVAEVDSTTGELKFLKAGTATVTITAAADESGNYKLTTKDVTVTVGKKELTLRALDRTAYVGSTVPDLSVPVLGEDYVIDGLVNGDEVSITNVLMDYEGTPDMTKPGTCTIHIASDSYEDECYTLLQRAVAGTLTVEYAPVNSYTVAVKAAENGSVTSNRRSATRGQTVTLTVSPADGYALDALTVTDAKGNEIELTDKGDGKYTFKMPASRVTVTATFKKVPVFTDIDGRWYTPYIEWAAENDIALDEDGSGLFHPDADCSRAAIVTFLWRAFGSQEPTITECPFTDVSESDPWYKAVLWAYENKITVGYDDPTIFAPDATSERAQTLTFLKRAVKAADVETGNDFTDVPEGAWFEAAVNWGVSEGLTNGYDDPTIFAPHEDCSRAQIIAFIYRLLAK